MIGYFTELSTFNITNYEINSCPSFRTSPSTNDMKEEREKCIYMYISVYIMFYIDKDILNCVRLFIWLQSHIWWLLAYHHDNFKIKSICFSINCLAANVHSYPVPTAAVGVVSFSPNVFMIHLILITTALVAVHKKTTFEMLVFLYNKLIKD